MVQIPTAEDIARVDPRSGRPSSSGPTPMIGKALAGFGQDVVKAAYSLNDLATRESYDERNKRANDVSTNLTRFLADQEQRFNEARDNASESGIGFTRKFMEGYQQQANEFAKSNFEGLSADDQTKYLNSILSHGNSLYEKANGFETKVKSAYYDRNTNQNLDTVRVQIRNNAANYDALKKQGAEAIQSADMPDWWKAEREAKWNAHAEESRWQWQFKTDPKGAIRDINPVGNALTLIRHEEGFREKAYWDTDHYRVGYGSDTYTTADGKVHPVTKDTVITQADAERDLERRSREFENTAIGQVGVDQWAKLPANARAALTSVAYNYGSLPNSVVEAVKGGDVNAIADAVGRLAANPKRRAREAAIIRGGEAVPASEQYADIPYDRREQLAKWADSQYRTDLKGSIDVASANAPAAIRNTGSYTGSIPTLDQFTDAYGAQDGAQRYSAFVAKVDAARYAYRFQTMPEADIKATLGAARPTDTGNLASAETDRYDAMSKAADETIKAREADPSTYTMKAFPKVAEAWSAAKDSGDYSTALSLTAAAESELGIKKPKLMPKDIAGQAVTDFKNVEKGDNDRLNAVASLVFATSDPDQRRAVFQQLVDAGLPSTMQGVMEAAARGDMGAAHRLMQAVLVDPSKLPKNPDVRPTDITTTIHSDVWDTGEVGDVAYGLTWGDAGSLERAQNATQLLRKAVEIRMAQGADLQTAVDGAKKDLFGDVQVYDGSGGINADMTVPADTDTAVVTAGLRAVKPEFEAALVAQRAKVISAAGGKKSDGTAAILDAATSNRMRDILDNGVFVETEGGVGLRDPYTGTFVTGANGKPFVVPMREILNRGQSAADDGEQAGSFFTRTEAGTPEGNRARSLDQFVAGPTVLDTIHVEAPK